MLSKYLKKNTAKLFISCALVAGFGFVDTAYAACTANQTAAVNAGDTTYTFNQATVTGGNTIEITLSGFVAGDVITFTFGGESTSGTVDAGGNLTINHLVSGTADVTSTGELAFTAVAGLASIRSNCIAVVDTGGGGGGDDNAAQEEADRIAAEEEASRIAAAAEAARLAAEAKIQLVGATADANVAEFVSVVPDPNRPDFDPEGFQRFLDGVQLLARGVKNNNRTDRVKDLVKKIREIANILVGSSDKLSGEEEAKLIQEFGELGAELEKTDLDVANELGGELFATMFTEEFLSFLAAATGGLPGFILERPSGVEGVAASENAIAAGEGFANGVENDPDAPEKAPKQNDKSAAEDISSFSLTKTQDFITRKKFTPTADKIAGEFAIIKPNAKRPWAVSLNTNISGLDDKRAGDNRRSRMADATLSAQMLWNKKTTLGISGNLRSGKITSENTNSEQEGDYATVAVSVKRQLKDKLVLGLSALRSKGKNDLRVDDSNSEFDVTASSVNASLSNAFDWRKFTVTPIASLGIQHTKRDAFTEGGGLAIGESDLKQKTAGVGLGIFRTYDWNKVAVTPRASAKISFIKNDDFINNAGENVAASSLQQKDAELGVNLSRTFKKVGKFKTITPRLDLSVGHSSQNRGNANLVSNLETDNFGNSINLSGGVDFTLKNNLSAKLDASYGVFQKDVDAWSVRGNLVYDF